MLLLGRLEKDGHVHGKEHLKKRTIYTHTGRKKGGRIYDKRR